MKYFHLSTVYQRGCTIAKIQLIGSAETAYLFEMYGVLQAAALCEPTRVSTC